MNIRDRSRLVLLLVAVGCLWSCSNPASKLPDYGRVPDFTMNSAEGGKFSSDALSGKVWVVDFIYTNCPAECPLMSKQMRKIEERLNRVDDVHFVSISVDPDRDTPQALKAFAHHFGGPSKQWSFLTGSPAQVHLLAYETFHVGDVIGKMEHSTKFAVVDKQGRIRGYYSSFDSGDQEKLVEDVRGLTRLGA